MLWTAGASRIGEAVRLADGLLTLFAYLPRSRTWGGGTTPSSKTMCGLGQSLLLGVRTQASKLHNEQLLAMELVVTEKSGHIAEHLQGQV